MKQDPKSPGYPNLAPSSLASGKSRRGERPAHRAGRVPVGIRTRKAVANLQDRTLVQASESSDSIGLDAFPTEWLGSAARLKWVPRFRSAVLALAFWRHCKYLYPPTNR